MIAFHLSSHRRPSFSCRQIFEEGEGLGGSLKTRACAWVNKLAHWYSTCRELRVSFLRTGPDLVRSKISGWLRSVAPCLQIQVGQGIDLELDGCITPLARSL